MPFYAVRRGHQPGIYETWGECQKQTLKFAGAQFKKFDSKEEAEQFMTEGFKSKKEDARYAPYKKDDKPSKGGKKAPVFYAVHKGHKTGVFETWGDCQEQIADFKGARYKKFDNREDAEEFVITGRKKKEENDDGDETSATSSKRSRKAATSDDFKPDAIVYTDGCCFMNGKHGACGGIGVYWGQDNENNLSEKLEGRQTNNRAEIEAACRAIEQAKEQGITKLEIRTDSEFMINSVTRWMDGWKQKGWTTSSKEPVKNAEDFKRLDGLMNGVQVKWTHVDGHSGVLGNEAADQLAKEGARK